MSAKASHCIQWPVNGQNRMDGGSGTGCDETGQAAREEEELAKYHHERETLGVRSKANARGVFLDFVFIYVLSFSLAIFCCSCKNIGFGGR